MFNFPALVNPPIDDQFFGSYPNDFDHLKSVPVRSKEERIKALETLVLSEKELAPFQKRIDILCDRKIVLAQEILSDIQEYSKGKWQKMLKMIGLFIGVALLGIAMIASVGAIGYGLGCLAGVLIALVTNGVLIGLIITSAAVLGVGVTGLIGRQAVLLLEWLLEKGRESIRNSSNFDALQPIFESKIREWDRREKNMGKLVADINEKLPRLPDLALRDALVYNYTKYEMVRHHKCDAFLFGDLTKEEFLNILNDENVHGVVSNLDLFKWSECWPKTLQQYDQLQLDKAKARDHLLVPVAMPAPLVNLTLSYMA